LKGVLYLLLELLELSDVVAGDDKIINIYSDYELVLVKKTTPMLVHRMFRFTVMKPECIQSCIQLGVPGSRGLM
jgi:hypothetical protein